MEMDSSLLEEILVGVISQSETVGVRSKESESDLSGLFDNFSKFTGQLDATSRHGLRKKEQVSELRISQETRKNLL
jgi:hypothetical protein